MLFPGEKKENIIKTDNSEEKESESTQKLGEQLSTNLYSKASEEIRHPLPPPGLSAKGKYSKGNNFSKIRKYERKNQDGRGSNEWIKKWNKKF